MSPSRSTLYYLNYIFYRVLLKRKMLKRVLLGASAFLLFYVSTVVAQKFVGTEVCSSCHADQMNLWQGSHHDWAMREATVETVLGDFSGQALKHQGALTRFYKQGDHFWIETENAAGELQPFKVLYTFGFYPLQQYLVEFGKGRLQVPTVAWDARASKDGGQRWFSLYPSERVVPQDPLHWTGTYFNWNARCAECHSTNLQKNFDAVTDTYNTTWSEINVACEACHGPGADHVLAVQNSEPLTGSLWPVKNTTLWQMSEKHHTAGNNLGEKENGAKMSGQISVCGTCHSRRAQLADVNSAYFNHEFEIQPITPPIYYADGQIREEDYVLGSFLQSRMYHQGVQCSNCHEPHSLTLKAQGNAVCAQCHKPSVFDNSEHHFHPEGPGSQCVNCHMPETTYMQVDPRRDHSLRIPRPDLSDTLGTPNACTQCHQDQTNQWAASSLAKFLSDKKGSTRLHFSDLLAQANVNSQERQTALLRIAGDEQWPGVVRAGAFSQLSNSPSQAVVEQSIGQLSHADPLIRRGALAVFERLSLGQRVEFLSDYLERLLSDDALAVRLEATRLLLGVSSESLTVAQQALFDQSVTAYADYLALQQDTPEGLLKQAEFLSATQEPNKALAVLEKAYRLEPNLPTVALNLADFYRAYGREEEAKVVLQKLLAFASNQSQAHFALGLLWVRQKSYQAAEEALAQAVAITPTELYWQMVFALALEKNGKLAQSISVLQAILTQDPNYIQALQLLVGYYQRTNQPQKAIEAAKRWQMLEPNNPEAGRVLHQLLKVN